MSINLPYKKNWYFYKKNQNNVKATPYNHRHVHCGNPQQENPSVES